MHGSLRRFGATSLFGVLACCGPDGGSISSSSGDATSEVASDTIGPLPATGGATDGTTESSEDVDVTGQTDSNDSTGSTGETGDGGSTGGERPAGVPMFIAQGDLGRTIVSCDDGRTWVGDRSEDDGARCFSAQLDCDHHAGAARGIVAGAGWAVATFGWGTPGQVVRTIDGVKWETVLSQTTFGAVAFGEGVFLAAAHTARSSSDRGETWSGGTDTTLAVWNVRRGAWCDVEGGRFVLVGEDGGTTDVVLSSDGGLSFWHPTVLPVGCGAGIQREGGIACGNGVLLIVGSNGKACSSKDGGITFAASSTGTGVSSHLVFDGEHFVVWNGSLGLRSTDGVDWQSDPSPSSAVIGPVARSDGGIWVAVKAGWLEWYDKQRFYRSEDGRTWEERGPEAARRSHPIRHIAFGRFDAAACQRD